MKSFITYYKDQGVVFLLILLFIFFLPSIEPLSLSSSYDEKRILQIIIFGITVLFTGVSFKFRRYISAFFKNIPKINLILVILFFSIGVLSSFFSNFPIYSLIEVSKYYLLLLLCLLIASSVHQISSASELIVYAFIGSALLFLVTFFSALIAGINIGTIDYRDLFIHFYNRRFFNQYQSISFPILLIAPLFLNTNKKAYYALSLLAALWVMFMLVSDGRGILIASLLGIIISGFLLPKKRKIWWAHSFLIIGGGGVLFLLFDWLLSNYTVINNEIIRATTSGRFHIWLKTLEAAKESPLIGIGPMHLSLTPMNLRVAHPHNITIQTVAEWGIPATLILIYFIGIAFYKWTLLSKQYQEPKRSLLTVALSSAFIAAVAHGHLSGVFVMPLSQLSFAVICGWMIGLYYSKVPRSNSETTSHSTLSHVIIMSISLLALSAILYGSLKYSIFPAAIEKQHLYLEGEYPAAKSPRFWGRTLILRP